MQKRNIFVLSICLLSSISSVFAEDYLGEGIDVGIYKKTSVGHQELKKKLTEKRVKGSESRIKNEIKSCGTAAEQGMSNLNFSPDELEELSQWITDSFNKRMKAGAPMNSELAACIIGKVNADYTNVKKEVGEEQKTLETIGSFWIYTDGSIKNSSFDLMHDLEAMHNLIFSKEIPYNGKEGNDTQNSTAAGLGSFFQAVQNNGISSLRDNLSLSDRLSYDLENAGWTMPTSDNKAPAPIDSISALCKEQSNPFIGLDPSIFGRTNTGDTATPTWNNDNNNSPIGISWGKPSVDNPGDSLQDALAGGSGMDGSRFACKSFFCIDVEFVTYAQMLLGGGKNNSVESVLQKNLKITDKYASTSFVQTKMTRNFFQMSLKDLNLPGMAHLWVVVGSMPAPLLNLKGENTPRGKPSESDDEKNMKEYLTNVFKDYGINQKRENDILENLPKSSAIEHTEGLTTEQARGKFTPPETISTNYSNLKQAERKNEYGNNFIDDLIEFEWFAHAWADNVGSFTSLIDAYQKIPRTDR